MVPGRAAVPALPGLHGSALECSARLLMPSSLARALASLRRTSLDRELAEGGDPASCPMLAARAAALAAERTRWSIAEALERAALDADRGRGLRIARSRPAVRANRGLLFDLAARLRRRQPVYSAGVAMLRLVLIDGAGPLYNDRHGDALTQALEAAGRRLDG